MKHIPRKTAKIAAAALGAAAAFPLALTLYHRISLKRERGEIAPNGQLVKIGGNNLHIYAEGENTNGPTLVFLSGAGTAAPVYDFKPLYSRLSGQYRIAVVEKLGYGYSDLAAESRDIDTILAQSREALQCVGIDPPYALVPHSASGLEALYWAAKYSGEIEAVIGLDMATPEFYLSGAAQMPPVSVLSLAGFIGLQRIPLVASVSSQNLSAEEFQQAQYLTYRNAANRVVAEEAKNLLANAATVANAGIPNVPMLLLCGNGDGLDNLWVARQEAFAREVNAELIKLDCGHYVHQFEPERIADEIRGFLHRNPRAEEPLRAHFSATFSLLPNHG
jgi:pimeloyl-ACP methyl ester carboxylesterase